MTIRTLLDKLALTINRTYYNTAVIISYLTVLKKYAYLCLIYLNLTTY